MMTIKLLKNSSKIECQRISLDFPLSGAWSRRNWSTTNRVAFDICNFLQYRLGISSCSMYLKGTSYSMSQNSNDSATPLNRFACENQINWLFIIARRICICPETRRIFVSSHENNKTVKATLLLGIQRKPRKTTETNERPWYCYFSV